MVMRLNLSFSTPQTQVAAAGSNNWDKQNENPSCPDPSSHTLDCHATTEVPDGSAIFFEEPKAALQGNHLPRLSEEPTYSLQEGVGWQKVLDRDDFPFFSPFKSQAFRT